MSHEKENEVTANPAANLRTCPQPTTKRPPRPRHIPRIHDVFQILVQCRDSDDQRELYERLAAEGRKCRLVGT